MHCSERGELLGRVRRAMRHYLGELVGRVRAMEAGAREVAIRELEAENAELREQMERRGTAAPTPAKRGFDDGSEAKVAQLEAQLASRDATIKALREQLSKLMGTTPPAETPPTPSKAKGK
jgi:hypothetical protein